MRPEAWRRAIAPGSVACDEAPRVIELSGLIVEPEHDRLKLGTGPAEVKSGGVTPSRGRGTKLSANKFAL